MFAFIWLNKVLNVFFIYFLFMYSFEKKTLLLLLLFVITIKLTRWSVNLSPSHSYMHISFGIICGPSWGSFAVLYSVERKTKSVNFAIFSYNNDNEWFSSNVRLSYEHRIMGSPGGKHWKSIQRNVWLGALCIYLPL